jgi:hypothetical protein
MTLPKVSQNILGHDTLMVDSIDYGELKNNERKNKEGREENTWESSCPLRSITS